MCTLCILSLSLSLTLPLQFPSLTSSIVLIEMLMKFHPSVAVSVDELESIDWVEEMCCRIITSQVLCLLNSRSKIL